ERQPFGLERVGVGEQRAVVIPPAEKVLRQRQRREQQADGGHLPPCHRCGRRAGHREEGQQRQPGQQQRLRARQVAQAEQDGHAPRPAQVAAPPVDQQGRQRRQQQQRQQAGFHAQQRPVRQRVVQ